MNDALQLYLDHVAATEDHAAAVLRAAESLVERPWEVLAVATPLVRCRLEPAPRDLGLTRQLVPTAPGGEGAVVQVEAGQPYPVPQHLRRRQCAAVDVPLELARRVVARAKASVRGELRTVLDPACGTGAFLLAATELGVPEVYGTSLGELELEVARLVVPQARLLLEDGLLHGPSVDLVVGSPPWIDPENDSERSRWELRRRYPWLRGRFDRVVPFAASAVERVRAGGAVGLVLPRAVLTGPHAAPLRRRWLERHAIDALSGPNRVGLGEAWILVMGVGGPRVPLPVRGLEPDELLQLANAPFDPSLAPGDVALVQRVRGASVQLSEVALVEGGLVIHGPEGGSDDLVHEAGGEGRVPFADAQTFFRGEREWLDHVPHRLHQPRSPALFEGSKLVVQRQRGLGGIRVGLDLEGVYVDHSCTVVRPHAVPEACILELLRSPALDGLLRIERGDRCALYARELNQFPVPRAWLEDPTLSLAEAWSLRPDELQRLAEHAG